MRKLIYVPIIHTSADLGSIAKEVVKRGLADLGEEFWRKHKEVVLGFWDVIIEYFNSIEVRTFKIYQDGMVAGEEVGKEIVKEGVKAGSKNYELVSRLLERGAILVKTEDFSLVKDERDRILKVTRAKTIFEKLLGFVKYKLTKNTLLNKRDRFIAKQIDETLKEGETGIIFIGAYHNVKVRLPKDIQINEIKDTDRVREYHTLLPFYNKNRQRIEKLGKYLREYLCL